ncbi:MAG: hypothetical protein KDL87_01215 [Verrucomicrobiae bacterium]|nr:hypothetical protein [Verrucomicrobiae bacterium]
MIPTEWGTKKPMQKGYTNFTLEKMSDPQHLALLERKNIAILTGAKSGNLISVDFDDDAAYQQFRACNPQLCSTVMTRASRGCNLWYRLKGQYPEGVSKLVNESGMEIGEWRAGNGITIVDGLHPSGVRYEVSSPGGVLEVSFDQIKWPEDWNKVPGRVDPFDVLAEEYGPPVLEGKQGGLQLNESFLAGWIAAETEIRYALESKKFYRYEEAEGIWKAQPKQVVDKLIAEYFARLARENNLGAVHFKKKATVINSVRSQLEAEVACRFYRANTPQEWRSFAARNTKVALILPSDKMQADLCKLPFSPRDRLIEKSCVDFVAGTACPRFLNEVLAPFLEPDDIVLLQKMLGLVLAGDNELQKILLLEGPGGTSKGVVTRVHDRVLGPKLVTELRTDHLGSRFETNRYRGKRLLAGRDVNPDFLRSNSAARLKALTGGDRLSTESKGSNEFEDIEGNFHVIITSNSPLLLRIDEDSSAWRRRLVIVPFHESERPFKIIQKFEEQLLREEGPGILRWMLDGALLAFSDINTNGTIALTAKQEARVDARVRASDSVAFFADECLVPACGGEVLSQKLLDAYLCFCESLALTAVTPAEFYRKIRSIIELRCGERVQYTENLLSEGSRGRGYRGLVLKPRTSENSPPHG